MDVRLTGSGNYGTRSTEAGMQEQRNIGKTGDSIFVAAKDKEEMKKLEIQGVPFSVGEEEVVKALDRAFKALEGPSTTLEVSMHKETKTIMVKILNKETGELIKEIPPEKTLDLVANMMEIAGIIVDQRV